MSRRTGAKQLADGIVQEPSRLIVRHQSWHRHWCPHPRVLWFTLNLLFSGHIRVTSPSGTSTKHCSRCRDRLLCRPWDSTASRALLRSALPASRLVVLRQEDLVLFRRAPIICARQGVVSPHRVKEIVSCKEPEAPRRSRCVRNGCVAGARSQYLCRVLQSGSPAGR